MFKTKCIFLILFIIIQVTSGYLYSSEIDDIPKKKRPKIGLVLSGGGAKGFAYLGMLKVFEEVGLHIDYIGGTSIGSAMGGLYAAGYSYEEIKKMIESQDWDALIRDEIPRKYIAYEEKQFLEYSIISIPLEKRKARLQRSMYKGQQINLMLNKYFSPVWDINDFSKLQTPFLCVATNLYNGDAEVLTNGYLPMAIRSSMSIPGYFAPSHFNGMYLIDGGVVNNYPAQPVQDKGAEYLIGGDVQAELKDTITELTSLISIINQVVSFHSEEANLVADSILNINIRFEVPAGLMDFNKYDTIIKYGEYIANQYKPELKALADSLNAIEYIPPKVRNAKPLKTLDINEVLYEGNKKMSSEYLDNFFGEFRNTIVSIDDIEDKITMVYGTKFFKYVFYELEKSGDGRANIIIKVEEASPGYLSASIHYDLTYNGSIRVNGIFRNILGNQSKLFGELVLGSNPGFRLLYLLSNGIKPGFGVDIEMYEFKFNYYKQSEKLTAISMRSMKAGAFATSMLNNLYSVKLGAEYELFKFKQTVVVDTSLIPFQNFNSYGSVFVKFRADTKNKPNFSTTGFDAEFNAHYCMNLSKGWVDSLFTNSLIMSFKLHKNLPLNKRFTLKPGLYFGWTLNNDEPPIQYRFGAGGLNEINYINNFVPFTGVQFIQSFGLYAAIARLKLQYNVYEKIYLTLRTDMGNLESTPKDLTDISNAMFGYGLTASYDSFIGPVELTVMGSNVNPTVSFFINIGFSF
jgi:NTE family protein